MTHSRLVIGAVSVLLSAMIFSGGEADARICRCRGGWRHRPAVYSNQTIMTTAPAAAAPMTTPQQGTNGMDPSALAPAPTAPPAAPQPVNNSNGN